GNPRCPFDAPKRLAFAGDLNSYGRPSKLRFRVRREIGMSRHAIEQSQPGGTTVSGPCHAHIRQDQAIEARARAEKRRFATTAPSRPMPSSTTDAGSGTAVTWACEWPRMTLPEMLARFSDKSRALTVIE